MAFGEPPEHARLTLTARAAFFPIQRLGWDASPVMDLNGCAEKDVLRLRKVEPAVGEAWANVRVTTVSRCSVPGSKGEAAERATHRAVVDSDARWKIEEIPKPVTRSIDEDSGDDQVS
tara:strand:+ start:346 stop:699 length:354 start_codon:yes stop_codon:yes gene_type:complete